LYQTPQGFFLQCQQIASQLLALPYAVLCLQTLGNGLEDRAIMAVALMQLAVINE
jgi:hypothetical protein